VTEKVKYVLEDELNGAAKTAAPALVEPETPAYPEEAEVVPNKAVVPLLFPWPTEPIVTFSGTP